MILVTGSAGFIGFTLSKKLLDDGIDVFGVDNFNNYYDKNLKEKRWRILDKYQNYLGDKVSIDNKTDLERIFKKYKFSLIVNLAAQAGVRLSVESPEIYVKSNITGFLNILELANKYGCQKVIYASSSSVYGNNVSLPFLESDKCQPVSVYGITKRTNELMAYAYSKIYDIQTIGLRFFTVYGPWGRPDMAYWLFADKIIKGEEISIYNYGNMKRDYTFIDDIIAGIVSCIDNDRLNQNEIFNLGNSNAIKLFDFIQIIGKTLKKKPIIKLLPMQVGDMKETYANISYAQQKLKYNPKVNINEGIPMFIDWLLSIYKY